MQIVGYRNCEDIDVRFEDGTILHNVQYGNFKRGTIKNPNVHDYCGTTIHGVYEDTREYHVWKGLLARTLNEEFKQKHKTYLNCTICEEWLNYNKFKKWYNDNEYEIGELLELDKDLKFIHNKLYSSEKCLLLPKTINTTLGFVNDKKSKLPIGVTRSGNYYQARIHKFGKSISIGYYNTPENAFEKYKKEKEIYWRELIDYYTGKIPNYIIEYMKHYNISERINYEL